MKKTKIIIALVLALALVFSLCVTVLAEGTEVTEKGADTSATEKSGSETQTDNTNKPSSWTSLLTYLIPIAILVAFFYFGILRPQKKQEKEKKQMMDALVVGANIVSIGGIMGKVVSIKDDSVIIESGSEKSRLQLSKQAISTVLKGE